MLSKDLRSLAVWFSAVAAGDHEMTHESARAFLKNLERAAEDAEALEEVPIVPVVLGAAPRPVRILRGPLPDNVVALRRPARPAPARGPSGGDAA